MLIVQFSVIFAGDVISYRKLVTTQCINPLALELDI